jgi:tripartite-type tricarboxylate transporter receptor subunit TctC
VSSVSIVVTVNPKSPDNSFAEFLARAKAQPGKLTYGTGGVGGPGHLAFELLRSMTGVDILHVPFKGGAQAITGLLGEQVDMVVDGTAITQVTAGRLRALAVTGPRLPALPDVPSIGETVTGFSFTNWWGFLAPAGAPHDVKRINEERPRSPRRPKCESDYAISAWRRRAAHRSSSETCSGARPRRSAGS